MELHAGSTRILFQNGVSPRLYSPDEGSQTGISGLRTGIPW